MNVTTVGIDLAKDIFHVYGTDNAGNRLLKEKIYRQDLLGFIGDLAKCTIVMEACGGANYWSRQFQSMGHTVKLISPQFVKPYVKGNKNDFNDTQGILDAHSRPDMRYVAPKTLECQDIQSIHRVRERYIGNRTGLANQIRGLLAEYGIVVSKGIEHLRKRLPVLLDETDTELTGVMKQLVSDLYEELVHLDEQVKKYDKQLKKIFKENKLCQRLSHIEGMGVISTTALVAAVVDPNVFKNGRHMSAWVGVVPRQHSSGGKQQLLGISKRGDPYLRKVMVHGARSVVYRAQNKTDKRSLWINSLRNRRGTNKACVAVVNKNIRIAWALMAQDEDYKKVA